MLGCIREYVKIEYRICLKVSARCVSWVPDVWIMCPICEPPKDWEIVLWSATNGSIPYILELAGSESSFNKITEYIYSSLKLTRVEFRYKSDQHIVPSVLIIGLSPFLRKYILLHTSGSWPTRVQFLHSWAVEYPMCELSAQCVAFTNVLELSARCVGR